MGWIYGFPEITETWCADAFEMTCKQRCGCLSELPLWATSWENMFMPYANKNDADQSTHLLFAAKIVSQRRKKHMARPGFESRISRIPCEHSVNWATEPHGWPVTISPCLIDSSPNLLITIPEPTKTSLCCSQPEHGPTLATKRHREEKHMARPGIEPRISKCHRGGKAHGPTRNRTQDLSHTVWELWPLSYRATRSTCDNSIIPKLTKSKIFKTLASICGCAGRFQSYLIENPQNRFSRDVAFMLVKSVHRCDEYPFYMGWLKYDNIKNNKVDAQEEPPT